MPELSTQHLAKRWNVSPRQIRRLAESYGWPKSEVNILGKYHRTWILPKSDLKTLDAAHQFAIQDSFISNETKSTGIQQILSSPSTAPRAGFKSISFEDNYMAIACLGDQHIGSQGTRYDLMERHATIINRTPGLYAIDNGDSVDNFIVGRLQNVGSLFGYPVEKQWKAAAYYYDILSEENKLLAKVSGNHDAWTGKVAGLDPLEMIMETNHVPYHPIEFGLEVCVGEQKYRIHMRHQYKGRSKFHDMQPALNFYESADHSLFDDRRPHIVVLGHTHSFSHLEMIKNGKKRHFVVLGSYKTVDSHSRMLGFCDAEPIMPALVFHPRKYHVELRKDLEETAQEYLPWLRNRR